MTSVMNLRKHLPSFFLAAFLPLLLLSCDNSFTPKEPFTRRIVVFAVLDKTAPYQTVRLESTYDSSLTNPNDPINRLEITDATVTIRSDKQFFRLHDTLVTEADGKMRKVWITYDLVPKEGTKYYLSAKVPGFNEITATSTVPGQAYLQMHQTQFGADVDGVTLFSGAKSASTPKGYFFRLWIAGEKLIGGNTVELRVEIPSGFDNSTGNYVYPAPSRDDRVFFPMNNITHVREELIKGDTLLSLKLIAEGYTFDTYLYSYYKVTRGFQDRVSVRQDSPDVTNIAGGVGIFGALVTDSIRAKYSDIISK
jgi:hypothetical protein